MNTVYGIWFKVYGRNLESNIFSEPIYLLSVYINAREFYVSNTPYAS